MSLLTWDCYSSCINNELTEKEIIKLTEILASSWWFFISSEFLCTDNCTKSLRSILQDDLPQSGMLEVLLCSQTFNISHL